MKKVTTRIEGVPVPKQGKGKRMIYGVKVWSLDVADNKFSHWIREQKDYTCEKCGKYVEPPTREIQCSHYIGRKHMATRFQPDNCDVFCATCHALWEDAKQYEYRDWKINKLGKERHEELINMARNSFGQKDAIFNCMKLLGKI